MEAQIEMKQSTKSENIFKNKNFMFLFSGRLVSLIGDNAYTFALLWYIMSTTKSATQSGIMLALQYLPYTIIGPFAGVFIDRWDRKKILVVTDIIRALILGAMGMLMMNGMLTMNIIYIGTLLIGINSAFFNPTCTTVIPNIVEEKSLTKANSMDTFANSAAPVLGTLLGGALYSVIGIGAIFFINAFSYTFAAIMEGLLSLPKRIVNNTNEGGRFNAILRELKEGYHYLTERRGLLILLFFLAIMNFFLYPIIQIYLPYIFNRIFMGTASDASFVSLALAVGMIIGAVTLSIRPQKEKFAKRIIINLFPMSLSLFGFMIPLLPSMQGAFTKNQNILLYIGIAVITGIFFGIVGITINVVFQKNVEDEYRGRVMALLQSLANTATPLGYFVAGFLVGILQMYVIVIIIAVSLILCTIGMAFSKSVRSL